MNVEALNLSAQVTARLTDAGLTTVAQVVDAGMEGLEAVNGIGPKTAAEVWQAVQITQAPPEVGGSTAEKEEALNPVEPDPNELVTVRNVADAMVLVGEQYLLPGQTRTVRRRFIRHIAPDKLEVR